MPDFIPRQCEHIRDTGLRCMSPAMRDRDFCYYHRRLHDTSVLPGDSTYIMPALESEQAIQLATTHILRAMLKGKIDRRDAATMFAGIRLAQASIRRTDANDVDQTNRMELEMTPAMESLCGADTPVRPASFATKPGVTIETLITQEKFENPNVDAHDCHGEQGRMAAANHPVSPDATQNASGYFNHNSFLCHSEDRQARGIPPASTTSGGNSRQRRAAMRRAERLMEQLSKVQTSAKSA